MSTRTLAVVFYAALVSSACGGDEEPSGPECMGMEMSVPGQDNDPCPQDDAMCVAAGGRAYAMCINGSWAPKCDCVVPNGGTMTGTMTQPIGTTSAVCGDNMITAPMEACDKTNLNGATCQMLGFNGGGTLLCNPTTCNYDTIMCRMSTGTMSGGGTSGGAGSGAGSGG